MVVLDEDSARRLAEIHGDSPPPVLPDDEAFQDPDTFDEDLADWESKLQGLSPRVNYRILTADIPIRGAKWSSD
jgi:hypothetical protein